MPTDALLATRFLRHLTLAAPPAPGRRAHVAAASGLACLGSRLYVVADDELHLATFRLGGVEPGRLVKLYAGELPSAAAERKRRKPDLEALTTLPGGGARLLAVPSGSRPARRCGALLDVSSKPQAGDESRVRPIDFSALYERLAAELSDLNIEGACVVGDALWLLQRACSPNSVNAVIQLDGRLVERRLGTGALTADTLRTIIPCELGALSGVALGFTDATPLPDGTVLYAAAAEATDNAYDDGEVLGSVLGRLDAAGRPVGTPLAVDRPIKIEGLTQCEAGSTALAVTDADDPDVPSALYALDLSALLNR